MLKFSMLLQAVDRFTAPARRMAASMKGLGRQSRQLAGDLDQSSRAYRVGYAVGNRLRGLLDRLAGGFGRAGRTAKFWAGKAGLGSWGDAAELAGRGVGKLIRKMGGFALQTAKWGALAGVAGTGWFVGGIVRIGAQFEQFQAQLEGTEGSVAGAKKAMEWVLKFAKDTPYEIDDVTDAFVRARQLGIDPMTGAMKSMGDAASGNRKTLMEAVEAIADAQTFSFERLKEFGITSSTKGGAVTFSFIDKGGKNALRTARKDAESIRETVLGIWDAKYAGGMIRQSKTLVGLWSNIKDSLTLFQYKIANAGWFESLKAKAAQFLETLNRWQDSGKIDLWAKRVSGWLTKMTDRAWEFITTTNWAAVGREIKDVALAVREIASALGEAVKFANKMSHLRDIAFPWVPTGRGLLKWWNSDAPPSPAAGATGGSKKAYRDTPAYMLRPGARRSAKPAYTPPLLRAPKLGPPRIKQPLPAPGRKAAANDVQVGGAIRIQVEAKGGTTARVASIAGTNRNVPVTVEVGRTMAGAA